MKQKYIEYILIALFSIPGIFLIYTFVNLGNITGLAIYIFILLLISGIPIVGLLLQKKWYFNYTYAAVTLCFITSAFAIFFGAGWQVTPLLLYAGVVYILTNTLQKDRTRAFIKTLPSTPSQQNSNTIPTNANWEARKLWTVIISLIILVGGMTYLLTISPAVQCTETQTPEPIPTKLINATIKFEGAVYFLISNEPQACSPVFRNLQGLIVGLATTNDLRNSQSAGYQVKPVPATESFKLINKMYVRCNGFDCADAGNPGEVVVLQDSQGKLWNWNAGPFLEDFNQKDYRAAYYVNGQRIATLNKSDLDITR